MKTFLKQTLFAFWIVAHSVTFAQEYPAGMHQWPAKGGTLILTSGLVTNGMALYVHHYNLYFQKAGDKVWYQIPVLDKNKPGQYELNMSAKAKDDRMVRDIRIEIRGPHVYLLRAQSARENDFEDSPITVTRYKLVETDGEDWPYYFEKFSAKTYPIISNGGVDLVLKKEAQQIK